MEKTKEQLMVDALLFLISIASEKLTYSLRAQQYNVKNKNGDLEHWEITVRKI